jgi:hypothetical protein
MTDSYTNIKGRSQERSLPAPVNPNGEGSTIRTSRYGEPISRPLPGGRHVLADEGTYFVAHNATNDAATTLAGHAAPVLADADATMTKPLVFVRVPAGATNRLYLDFIELEVVTAPTGATTDNWAAQLDTGTTRYSSGGTALTIVNPNMQSTNTSLLASTNALLGGAVVVGAEGANVRELGHGQIRAAIAIVGDRYVFKFGGENDALGGVVATAASRHVISMPPVILGATDQFLLALYAPSQSAAAVYKMRMGWWER